MGKSEHVLVTDDDLDLAPPKRTRVLVAVLVVLIHVAVVLGLIAAFAPKFTASVTETVLSAVNVTITAPPPDALPDKAGAAAVAGKKAVPRDAAVPRPKLTMAKPSDAPPVTGVGQDNAAGAGDTGSGTGAGGQGNGSGAGAGGNGQGGGAASKAVKIAGEISTARDYPQETRDLRLGASVTLALTIGRDGRVKNCRIHRASRDTQSDQITCRLAIERFRFRPATDGNGNPIESIYGWQQRWWDPRGGN